MEHIKYYEDVENGFLFAYEKESEFFVCYVEKSNAWEDCKTTFAQVRHDYSIREIGLDEANQKTNGNLPERLFQQYVAVLSHNRG